MGGEVIIDTDFVHWFVGHGPAKIVGPCPHDCDHWGAANIAWGPDLAHYTLDECCECRCRAWSQAKPPKRTAINRHSMEWMQVEPNPALVRRKGEPDEDHWARITENQSHTSGDDA